MFTREYLLERFHYDRENGRFIWKKVSKFQPKLLGTEAGCTQDHGHTQYRFIKLEGSPRLVHRLVWLMETGEMPVGDVDHIDGNGLNNRISNLREVSRRVNLQNKKCHRDGHLPGTTFEPSRNKWRAKARLNGVMTHIGRFNTQVEAHQAYLNATRDESWL